MKFLTYLNNILLKISDQFIIWNKRIDYKKTIPIILLLLVILFYIPIEGLVIKLLINPFLKFITSNLYNDLIFSIVAFLFLFYNILNINNIINNKVNKKKICLWSVSYAILIFITYLFLRNMILPKNRTDS